MADNLLTYGKQRWLWFGMAPLAVLGVSYLFYSRSSVPYGGTSMGLVYGVIGTALIVWLMALGIRKRRRSSGTGTVQGWTSAHVYLGLLTLVIIPFHTGFRFQFGIPTLAYVLLVVVILSGIVGVVCYVMIPPRLTRCEAEAGLFAERVAEEIHQLLEKMAALSQDKSDVFVRTYQEEVQRTIGTQHLGWKILLQAPGSDGLSGRTEALANCVPHLPARELEDFQRFSKFALHRTKLEWQLLTQMRLRNAMQAWLYIHLPCSYAMLVALVVHLVTVLYY